MERRIIVTADRAERTVEVGTQIDAERRLISLAISGIPADPWTWLAPIEAREVAEALIAAADELEG
jgi:hypothetical protein